MYILDIDLYIIYIIHKYFIYKYYFFLKYTCMCVYLYIYTQNNYTQCIHIYYVNTLLFWMRLIQINRLTALVEIIPDFDW